MKTYKELWGNNVAIIGVSPNNKSSLAIKELIYQDYKVYPINPNRAEEYIQGQKIFKDLSDIDEKIDFASIYVNPTIFSKNDLASKLHDKRIKGVILNPGSEAIDIVEKLTDYEIEVVQECTVLNLRLYTKQNGGKK